MDKESGKIQILILVVLIVLLAVVCLELAFFYPKFELMIVRPVAGFLISAIVGAIFRELRTRKKIKIIIPKIRKRKP